MDWSKYKSHRSSELFLSTGMILLMYAHIRQIISEVHKICKKKQELKLSKKMIQKYFYLSCLNTAFSSCSSSSFKVLIWSIPHTKWCSYVESCPLWYSTSSTLYSAILKKFIAVDNPRKTRSPKWFFQIILFEVSSLLLYPLKHSG